MARSKLKVSPRNQTGRKVKKLRQEGLLPGNVYGKKVKSLSIQTELKVFRPIYKEAGETALIDLQVEGEKSVRPVLVHNVQTDPLTDLMIHVDFHQVDLTQKVKAAIPLEIVGEAPAIAQKLGILVRITDEIEVEALPTDLPEKIEVEISGLAGVGDMVKVGDLKVDSKVEILAEADEPLVKIEPPTKIEEEAPAEEEGVEGEEGEEGAEAAEGAEGEGSPDQEEAPAKEEKSAE